MARKMYFKREDIERASRDGYTFGFVPYYYEGEEDGE